LPTSPRAWPSEASAQLWRPGLVGVTSSSASAAPVTTAYTCATPIGAKQFPVVVDIALLPSTAPAGFPVPAGLLSFNSTLTVPADTAPVLSGAGVTGGKSDDFGTSFGDTVAKAPVLWNTATTNGDGSITYSGKGTNAAFQLPEAGTYSVNMPKTFNLAATNAWGGTVVRVTCTSAAPSALGTIELSKQASKVKAKAAPKAAKKGAVVTVKGKVTNEYVKTGGPEATGKVIIKDGKKKVGTAKLKKGKFVVKLKGLAVGSHKLTVLYKGDGYTDKGKSKAVTVKITK
jgi:hypothetical protein